MERTLEFAAWLGGLRDRAGAARIQVRIARLELGNPGAVAAVGEGVSEMKIDFGPCYRVYFGQHGSELVVLLQAAIRPRRRGTLPRPRICGEHGRRGSHEKKHRNPPL